MRWCVVLLVACTTTDTTPTRESGAFPALEDAVAPEDVQCGPSPLVQGAVEREERRTTFNEPLTLTHTSLWVLRVDGIPAADAASVAIAELVIGPVTALPTTYCIPGDAGDTSRFMDYVVSGTLYQTAGESTVGDLATEYYTSFEPPAEDVRLVVSGVESCDSPDAGGFCFGQ
jgi:hypothetical protein